MKFARLLALASLASVLPAAAATYQVNGIITSSELFALPEETNFTLKFDYLPATVGADLNGSPTSGFYLQGISNVTITFNATTIGIDVEGFAVTNTSSEIAGGDHFAPQIFGFSPHLGEPEEVFLVGEFRFRDGENRWDTDAAPSDITTTPWEGGSLYLYFERTDDGSSPVGITVNGTLDMGSLEEITSVPEPASAALIGLVGTTLLVRRRRF